MHFLYSIVNWELIGTINQLIHSPKIRTVKFQISQLGHGVYPAMKMQMYCTGIEIYKVR